MSEKLIGIKKLLFNIQNLSQSFQNNVDLDNLLDDCDTEEEYNTLDSLNWYCYNILLDENYNIPKKIKEKCKLLLNFNEDNKTILVANIILKLNLENQKLS